MSSSHAYLHPILGSRPNLTMRTNVWASRIVARRPAPRHRRRVPHARPAHARRRVGAARGHRQRGRDRHAEAAHALGHRARARHLQEFGIDVVGGLARRGRQPRRPRRGHRAVGRGQADDPHLDAVVGDRPVLDLRARARPARPDDALRLGAVRHEHHALGLPDDRERLLPDAERLPRALARHRAPAHARLPRSRAASTRATSPIPRATTSR